MNVADVVEDRTGDLPVGRIEHFQRDRNLPLRPLADNRRVSSGRSERSPRPTWWAGWRARRRGPAGWEDISTDGHDRVDAAREAHASRGRADFGGDPVIVAWMPCMATNSSGIAMATIHAPCGNLVIRTITNTTAVMATPMALIAWERWIFGRELPKCRGSFRAANAGPSRPATR